MYEEKLNENNILFLENCKNNINLWDGKTNLIWNDDLRELVLSCLQDPNYTSLFSNGDNYCIYWLILQKFMEQKYNKKSQKTDKFLFLLLLTYNVKYIKNLESFSELRIAFNEIIYKKSSIHSDFTCIGYYFSTSNHCICSQHIDHIFIFYNNISGVEFNVGSVCNDRHSIISKEDENYKKAKQIKNKNKKQKTDIADTTHSTNLITHIKVNEIVFKPCIICQNTHKQNIQYNNDNLNKKLPICSCVPYTFKLTLESVLNDLLLNTVKMECQSCNLLVCIPLTRYLKEKEKENVMNKIYLCTFNDCKSKYKEIKCKKCVNKDIVEKNNNDELKNNYCQKCCVFMKTCQDCNTIFCVTFHNTFNNMRCLPCYKIKKENVKTKDCIECNLPFQIKLEEESWRKTCLTCYKNNCRNCIKCEKKVFIKTSNKDCSKGKKYYKCSNIECGKFEWV
jgi:hypothetical protein